METQRVFPTIGQQESSNWSCTPAVGINYRVSARYITTLYYEHQRHYFTVLLLPNTLLHCTVTTKYITALYCLSKYITRLYCKSQIHKYTVLWLKNITHGRPLNPSKCTINSTDTSKLYYCTTPQHTYIAL